MKKLWKFFDSNWKQEFYEKGYSVRLGILVLKFFYLFCVFWITPYVKIKDPLRLRKKKGSHWLTAEEADLIPNYIKDLTEVQTSPEKAQF